MRIALPIHFPFDKSDEGLPLIFFLCGLTLKLKDEQPIVSLYIKRRGLQPIERLAQKLKSLSVRSG